MDTKINVPCTLEQRISAKSGKPYYVLVVKLTNTYEKNVFLDQAEIELVKLRTK